MPTDTYTASDTWTCPAGVTSVDVECWGGGGGGYAGSDTGGAGGGAYSKKTGIAVTPTTGYTVTVGAGGNQGLSPQAGGDSWFSTSGTVLAKGGSAALTSGPSGQPGGDAESGIGDTKFSGGTGGNAAGDNGGAGGGGAGNAANGGNGSGTTGGTGGSIGGGNGGAGGTPGNNGSNGSTLGGGGGTVGIVGSLGGNGARGEVRITYILLEGQPTMRRWGGIPGMRQGQLGRSW